MLIADRTNNGTMVLRPRVGQIEAAYENFELWRTQAMGGRVSGATAQCPQAIRDRLKGP